MRIFRISTSVLYYAKNAGATGVDNMNQGEKIRNLRERKGWSQAELAMSTNFSEGYIKAIEEGRQKPKLKNLSIIASALGIGLDQLLHD